MLAPADADDAVVAANATDVEAPDSVLRHHRRRVPKNGDDGDDDDDDVG